MMMRGQIVAVVGKAGSGKDTVAEMLSAHGVKRVAFADPLKEFCRDVFGFTDAQLWGPSDNRNAIDPRWGISPRHALQTLGTEWGRAMHPEVWVRLGIRRALALTEQGTSVVFTDCRFPNEADALREAGAEVWKIERPGAGLVGSAGAHASEQGIDAITWHRMFPNVGTLEDLRRWVDATWCSVR